MPADRALRLLVASDGLWDLVTYERAARAARSKPPHEVCAAACVCWLLCVAAVWLLCAVVCVAVWRVSSGSALLAALAAPPTSLATPTPPRTTTHAHTLPRTTPSLSYKQAAAQLAAAAARDRRMADDLSLIVIDVLPEPGVSFPVSALRAGAAAVRNHARMRTSARSLVLVDARRLWPLLLRREVV